MSHEMSPGKPTTRRYSEVEKERAVRMVRQLRKELGTDHGTIQLVATQLGIGRVAARLGQADQAEPVIAGARTTFVAVAAEARWWVEPRNIEAVDPDERGRRLNELFSAGELSVPELRQGLALAWGSCRYPEQELLSARWMATFTAAGFVSDGAGNRQPTEPVEVFRACDPGRERRLTWTTSQDAARGFQRKNGRAELWRATVPPAAVLAMFGPQDAVEVVGEPARLDALERVMLVGGE